MVRINEHYNHTLTKELFERMPKQRALSPDALTQVRDAIDLITGKNVTLKDISNKRQYLCIKK